MNTDIETTKIAFHSLYPTAPQLSEEFYANILAWFTNKKEWEGEYDDGAYDYLTTAPDAVWIFWQMYRIVDHPLWEGIVCDWEPNHDVLNGK